MFNPANKVINFFPQNISFFKSLLFLATLLVILSCSIFTNAEQSTSHQTLNDNDLIFLKNTDKNNLSYIGEDGNIWITDENKNFKITDFVLKSRELPISSYYWSPDGKKLAVQANTGIYIFSISPKGIDRHFLGNNSFLLGDLPQPWSPDSKKILTSQFGFKSLDLWEITHDETLETRSIIKPLSISSHFIWLPDSESFAMSVDWLEDIPTGTICSGIADKIRISIVDIQSQSENTIYEGWGTSFDVFENKIVFIGGDDGCAQFPIVYDLEKSEILKFDNAVTGSSLCFGDHKDNIAIFTVSKHIDASQSIFLIDTDTMTDNNIEFGDEISKLIVFKTTCTGYFWSNDKRTLFFNSDVYWGGKIIRVDIQSNKMYPFAGEKKSEPQFVLDLPNAQVVDILYDDNILVSGEQNGQINALYFVNIEDSQINRLGNEAFWVSPSYFGQSQNGLLVIEATDIQTQLINIYWVNTNGDVIKKINNASQPNWQPTE